jgi:putative membrane-bound dehydrogenase-like protein
MIKPLFAFFVALLCYGISVADEPDTPYAINTQAAGEHPPSAAEAAAMITVPDGFQVSLFAGDPDVHQPIALEIDDRGRLWVAECYTYEGGEYDLNKRDRIVIFEDTDGDGRFDRRKVFWDKGQRLTGLTLGFGGVWITSAPHLMFLPDRDGNDLPDGEPEIVLEGFSILARHNMVNGLRWGPDGWLYGRHGITDTSTVGTPQTPHGKRTRLNCSIWRYHPQRKVFEVVTHGTTNPWGLDYNDHGQWFFTNNVINHLWHVVPGAHYQRMHGDDFNPHLYELIQPTADHFHWDTDGANGEATNKNRKQYDGRHDGHGGGHSHAGGMIYLGDNWPQKYRGVMLMCNTHGRRVNADRLFRHGNSYLGKHEPDFLVAGNEWFRGVELKYGPDGGVFLTDWSDLGECHDRDGVHRSSGRIYKITHDPIEHDRVHRAVNLRELGNDELVDLQLHRNDWFVRHARRLLQERAVAGVDLSDAKTSLLQIYQDHDDVTRRLRAMWALASIDALPESWLIDDLDDPNEHIRAWAVRLLVDRGAPSASAIEKLTEIAESDTSGLVRLFLASALQRLELADRWVLAGRLARHDEDARDRVQPLMIWYGIEAAIPTNPQRALELAMSAEMPLLRRHIARRLTEEIDGDPATVNQLIKQAVGTDKPHAADYLQGMTAALGGRHRVAPPTSWIAATAALSGHDDARIAPLQRELSVVFGDGRAVDELLAVARDGRGDPAARRDALRVVLESRPKGLAKTLLQLKNDKVIGAAAIRGLARYEDPQVAKQLLNSYPNAKHDHRPAIIDTLASRRSYAAALLDAVKRGLVNRRDISAAAAANIAGHHDSALSEQLENLWGAVQTTPKEKLLLISQHRARLTPENLAQANLDAGRSVFQKVCGNCHKMFGEGKTIGPDLTGSNRDNLDYLLENIIDPSRVVPAELRQSAVLLLDGRVINGTITRQNENTLTIQTITEEYRVPREEVETIRKLTQSLMPDGLMTPLTDNQVRDLIGYLQTSR